jgi:hypothetical protein
LLDVRAVHRAVLVESARVLDVRVGAVLSACALREIGV